MMDPKSNKPSEELVLVKEVMSFEVIELDDTELDKVAGGNGTTRTPINDCTNGSNCSSH